MKPIEEKEIDLEDVVSDSGWEDDEHHDGVKPVEIAKKETRMVNYSKILVIVVIIAIASVMGYATYRAATDREETNYQIQFDNVAGDIITSSDLRGQAIFGNLEGVSVTITTWALGTGVEWPFILMPHFQVIGMVSNSVTGASTLGISPIVKHEQREAWERFSVENSMSWLAEGHMYDDEVHPDLYVETRFYDQPKVPLPFPVPAWNESGSIPYIWEFTPSFRPVPLEEKPFYIPYWQVVPAMDYASPQINLDTNANNASAVFNEGVLRYKKPVLSSIISANYLAFNYDQRFSTNEQEVPHSYVYYPVFDTFKKDRDVVAILNAFIQWDQFFFSVLPEGEKPVVVVLDSTCQQSLTYELRGDRAYFVGNGDLHDPTYDRYAKSAAFQSLGKLDDVDGFSCDYSIRIYPTEEWSEEMFTTRPAAYAAAIVSCFLVTTLVFVLYDFFVYKRNKRVMESATKTNHIVSSLFPSNVRDRLMDEIGAQERKSSSWARASDLAKSFSNPDDSTASLSHSSSYPQQTCITSSHIFGSSPIADLFPNTTIMFADLVGFTGWSSIREPAEVFMLLETLFHSFDQIAKKRRVFKVETVGDCYVAATGLPVPRKDHALAMARFAHDILIKMSEVSQCLSSQLGLDTTELSMRIGIHSGPVTAGVLRGEKGRFQLFGDAMNVASRMESTGTPGKIQVSKETADLISTAGKSEWVVPRDDRVLAKGKGELQTYFLNIKATMAETASNTASGSLPLSPDTDMPESAPEASTHGIPVTSNEIVGLVDV